MGIREDVLKLADELDRSILEDSCETCVASGTESCIHFLKCVDSVHVETSKRLRAIADKDVDDVTTMSAYDLLPEDERKAIAWVREHGGIAEVKDEWKRRNNLKRRLEKAQDKVGRQQRHIEELQRKLAERRDGINAMRSKIAEMHSRLMPEGVEWPRFEDGEPVGIGDEIDFGNARGEVNAVKFIRAKRFVIHCFDKGNERIELHYIPGECVKRPAPKVVDADGVEIREGDTVWDEHADELVVLAVYGQDIYCRYAEHEDQICDNGSWAPSNLTHRAPVLAADGKPLKEGDTVYEAGSSCPDGMAVEDIDGGMVGCRLERYGLTSWPMFKPDQLTHEQPDDWSRWREDLELSPVEYADRYRVGRFGHEELDTYRDLVRRAKKLAEKEPR